VLLLDEPTVGLDAQARAAVLDVLRQVRGKRSVVVASHDDEVLSLADDVITLP
jgi:ABC-type multidrug transport system ATPase subunit